MPYRTRGSPWHPYLRPSAQAGGASAAIASSLFFSWLAVSDHYTMGTTALSGNTRSFKLARGPVEPKPNACAANGWSGLVKRRPSGAADLGPFNPQQRTSEHCRRRSEKCHKLPLKTKAHFFSILTGILPDVLKSILVEKDTRGSEMLPAPITYCFYRCRGLCLQTWIVATFAIMMASAPLQASTAPKTSACGYLAGLIDKAPPSGPLFLPSYPTVEIGASRMAPPTSMTMR